MSLIESQSHTEIVKILQCHYLLPMPLVLLQYGWKVVVYTFLDVSLSLCLEGALDKPWSAFNVQRTVNTLPFLYVFEIDKHPPYGWLLGFVYSSITCSIKGSYYVWYKSFKLALFHMNIGWLVVLETKPTSFKGT